MNFRIEPDQAPIIVVFASLAALVTAYVAQYGFDLQPCVLCLYQRWPYGVAIVIAMLAISSTGGRKSGARRSTSPR